jgi:peptidoglycan/xylan/chitin deacetylase (PgdA/CDA1 family)
VPTLRLDRLVSVHVFHPLNKRRTSIRASIPVLMYHSVTVHSESGPKYYRTTTSPTRFAEHMRFLYEHGYTAVELDNVVRSLEGQSEGVAKLVAITFDDGFANFYTNAFPILQRYGLSASMFLPTLYISASPRRFKNTQCMTWDQVYELSKSGISFGSHTVNHPQLHVLKASDRLRELRESKDSIEQRLGTAVQTFSYPYAFPEQDRAFRRKLAEELAESGYSTGVSTIVGRAASSDSRFFLKRLPINDSDDQKLFRAKLEGGYDWLHSLQYATKLVRSGSQQWR